MITCSTFPPLSLSFPPPYWVAVAGVGEKSKPEASVMLIINSTIELQL